MCHEIFLVQYDLYLSTLGLTEIKKANLYNSFVRSLEIQKMREEKYRSNKLTSSKFI